MKNFIARIIIVFTRLVLEATLSSISEVDNRDTVLEQSLKTVIAYYGRVHNAK